MSTTYNYTDDLTTTSDDIFTFTMSWWKDDAINDTSWTDSSLSNATTWATNTSAPPGNATKSGSIPFFIYPMIAAEMILSIICLMISLAACYLLPEFRNVHGKNLASLSATLLTSYSLLTVDVLGRKGVSKGVCLSMAVGIQVTFLATFFWTNVMAYDVYRTISDMKPKSEGGSRSRRYRKYSGYAWSATLLTSLPSFVAEWSGGALAKRLRPRFGQNRCWLSGTDAFELYFNLPVGLILLGNVVMFLLTVRRLRMIKEATKMLPPEQQQKRFNLHVKLFLVMGITWAAEFLPWATGYYELYALAGMLTALHGVFLFIIFVAKKKILLQLWYRCCCLSANDRLRKISRSMPTLSTSASSKM